MFVARKLEFIGFKVFFRWNLRWRRREKLFQQRIVLKNYYAKGGLPDWWQYFGDRWPKLWVLGFLRWIVYLYWFQSWLHHFSNSLNPYIWVCLFYTPHHFRFWDLPPFPVGILRIIFCLSSRRKGVSKYWIWETLWGHMLLRSWVLTSRNESHIHDKKLWK